MILPSFVQRATASLLLRRTVFWAYALALFIGTHWPRLELPETVIERPDLIVHAAVFGLWTFLFIAAGYTGLPRSRSAVLRAGLVALLYAAFDEGTQAIPFIHRTAVWDDFLANAVGVLLVTFLAAARARGVHPISVEPDSSPPVLNEASLH